MRRRGRPSRVKTAVAIERLRALNAALLATPNGFAVHRKLERGREKRRRLFDDPDLPSVDWAAAEELACASILEDGTPIRITGEDVERGTFSHRHAVLYDAETGQRYSPLESFAQATASYEIRNSPLSENAVVGFEYGYNVQAPERLVIWEAQYGDFINGAQLMLDEFVLSARAKWGQEPSLVMLLPHGYEGQGPDHASARPERFLELAADINLRLANCTTAAQYFHLLRRQAALLKQDPLPLIVLTPKSLLRHPLVASRPRDLAEGRWMQVIDDPDAEARRRDVRRLVVCTGKIAIDLLTSPHREKTPAVAICRVEQIYPLPVAGAARRDRGISRARGSRLDAGRAGEHGRLGLRADRPRRSRRLAPPRGARPAAQLQPGRRVGGASRTDAGTAGLERVRFETSKFEISKFALDELGAT